MKLLDISSALPRRATKVTNERLLYFLNELIKADVMMPVYKTFNDYFDASKTITMVSGTTEYAMPDDFGVIKTITTSTGKVVYRGGVTPKNVTPKDKVRIYGGKLIVDEKRSFSALDIEYYKAYPEFNSSDAIDLPDDVSAIMKNIWITGAAYFFFSENKKTQETATSFARYGDAKVAVLSFDVGSII